LGFLLSRVLYEATGVLISKKLGSDVLVYFTFASMVGYQFAMCMLMSSTKHWIIFVELLFFDCMENIYYLCALHKASKEDDDEASSSRRLRIACLLLIREIVELLVPVVYASCLLLFRASSQSLHRIVCTLDSAAFSRALQFLLIDIAVEGVIFVFTFFVLQNKGLSPGRLACGVVKVNLGFFARALVGLMAFYIAMQHAHYGMDWTFEFLWLQPGARWKHALVWEAPIAA